MLHMLHLTPKPYSSPKAIPHTHTDTCWSSSTRPHVRVCPNESGRTIMESKRNKYAKHVCMLHYMRVYAYIYNLCMQCVRAGSLCYVCVCMHMYVCYVCSMSVCYVMCLYAYVFMYVCMLCFVCINAMLCVYTYVCM